MSDSGSLIALGANGHNLAGVKGAFRLYYAAQLALSSGLYMLGDHVSALDDYLALGGGNFQHLTLFTLVLAGNNHYLVAFFNV